MHEIRFKWCVAACRPDGKWVCEFDGKHREIRDNILPMRDALYVTMLPRTLPASKVICPSCGKSHEVTMHPKSKLGWSFYCPCGARGDWWDWKAPGKIRWQRGQGWCYARPDGQILREENWREADE